MKNFAVTLALSAIGFVVLYSTNATGAAVPGYFDESTGRFVPAQARQSAATPMVMKTPASDPVTRTGTFKIIITLGIDSAIGMDEPIICAVNVSNSDASYNNQASTSTYVVRTSATTGTATLTIPYEWTMAEVGEAADISASCNQGQSSGGVYHFVSFEQQLVIAVPASGTTTTKTLSASI